MYAIRNKKTGKFVYGTDKRYRPFHQRTSDNRVMTFDELIFAAYEFEFRQCGKAYEIVELEAPKVKRAYTREETEKAKPSRAK